MDTDTLISKVFLRPAIWDKRLKVYTNRAVVDSFIYLYSIDHTDVELVIKYKHK
jgi:hypothetical protein